MKTLTTEKTIEAFCERGWGVEACLGWLDDIWEIADEADENWDEDGNHPFSDLMNAIYHDLKAAAFEAKLKAGIKAHRERMEKALSEGVDAK